MSGTALPEEETLLCRRYSFAALPKPFLAQDMLALLEAQRLHRSTAATPR